jgi:uncharacterized protein YdeI (BOF family)
MEDTVMKAIKRILFTLCMWTVSSSSFADDPATATNNSWITVDGVVESVRADEFTLDYGEGKVLVEMDDGDRDSDAYMLVEGDRVTVNGKIDQDFWETKSIEAARVYVEGLNTTYYSSAIDEEDYQAMETTQRPSFLSTTVMTGVVRNIDGETFILDTGDRDITVETQELRFNPLDDSGTLQIEEGDRVSVYGLFDSRFVGFDRLIADSITEFDHPLNDDRVIDRQ